MAKKIDWLTCVLLEIYTRFSKEKIFIIHPVENSQFVHFFRPNDKITSRKLNQKQTLN